MWDVRWKILREKSENARETDFYGLHVSTLFSYFHAFEFSTQGNDSALWAAVFEATFGESFSPGKMLNNIDD